MLRRDKLTKPAGLEVTHVRGQVLQLREEANVRLCEVHGELLTLLGQDRDALTQKLNLLLVLNLKAHTQCLLSQSILAVSGEAPWIWATIQWISDFNYD